MTYLQKIIHYLGQSIGSLLKVFKWHPKKQKSNPILSEESSKMSPKTPSQDSPSEIEWKLEDMQKAYLDSADEYDKIVGG